MGSTFHGSSPSAAINATEAADAGGLAGSSGADGADGGAGRRVLIVDDHFDAAESLAELLRLFDHTVQIAFDPHAALELANRFAPEVAILDITLPGMDGYELALRLREQGAARCTFIAVSGHDAGHDLPRSRAAGFAAHLVKPVDFDALHAAIQAPPAPA